MKKIVTMLLMLSMLLAMAACAGAPESAPAASQAEEITAANAVSQETAPETRIITDSMDRNVEIPYSVERIVCVGVGALRYTCYVGGADRVVGVEDYETKPGMSRLYNYVNFDLFQNLPVTGTNGEPFVEEIINVDPQVIVMSSYASQDPDELSQKTGIPVVVVPGSDTTLDEKAYVTIRILGELYQLESRAEELTAYLEKAMAMIADLNGKIVVFGSGKCRTCPLDVKFLDAYKRLVEVCRLTGEIAGKYGIKVVIEPLSRKETNMICTVAEGAVLQQDVANENVGLLADYFHICANADDVNSIAVIKDLDHIHIASGNGRRYPLPGDGESYGALFAALRAAGYNARMSIEGKTENIAQDGKAALAYMKQLEADNG